MKTKFTIIFTIFIQFFLFSQETEITFKTVKLIEPRNVYLNGGFRASLGGKSREIIKIDLPEKTIKWYYSFSVQNGQSGAQILNLAIQLAPLFVGVSSVPTNLLSNIKVPEGSGSADIILTDYQNAISFSKKVDLNGGTYTHYTEGTVHNTRNGVIEINDVTVGTVFLCLRNPSTSAGVNINIEVVAVVQEIIVHPKSDTLKKAEIYGNMGWKKFELGQYEKCIEYSDKSMKLCELGWVVGNKGLSLLLLNKEDAAIDVYVHAISLIKKQKKSLIYLKALLKDIEDELKKNPNLPGGIEIKELIELEM